MKDWHERWLDSEDRPPQEGVLYGWRDFYYVEGYLFSRNMTPWVPRQPLQAECPLDEHPSMDAPVFDCTCGIYAYRDRPWRERELPGLLRSESIHAYQTIHKGNGQMIQAWGPIVPQVRGRVSLWGRYIKHDSGYRAQFAYPYELFVVDDEIANDLRSSYGCDVTVVGGLETIFDSIFDFRD